MKNILEITKGLRIPDEYVIPYGFDKAKIDLKYFDQLKDKKCGKLVLVTACCNAEVAGMGKTSTEIAVNQ
ncbi:MAG: formate--tetrahydrofolate ligase, partial [Candidatus Onthovivens sp.]|nr:formate--tetrahydrofolate ligase [Candidatus Onthovivens sp.]